LYDQAGLHSCAGPGRAGQPVRRDPRAGRGRRVAVLRAVRGRGPGAGRVRGGRGARHWQAGWEYGGWCGRRDRQDNGHAWQR